MNKLLYYILILLFLNACRTTPLPKANEPIFASGERTDRANLEAVGERYAISTHAKYTTLAAQKILEDGGNLIDAAIAASFVVAVERPQSTGIGGGGFMLYREAKTGKTYAVDFRERAPLKATESMYLDKNGKPDKNLSRNGALAVGVPGMVAGLSEIHHRFGSMPWSRLLQPAVELARNGYAIYPSLAQALKARAQVLRKDPAAAAIFLDAEGNPWPEGHILVQKDLAQTLQLIAHKGRAGFYRSRVAKKMVQLFAQQKGLVTQKDLDEYTVKWHNPVSGTFNGFEIVSMPPPSSGGIHVIQFLNFLEQDHLEKLGLLSAPAIHLEVAALQSAFADRARYLGDPAFTKVPVEGLISKQYAQARRRELRMDHARKAIEVMAGNPLPYEHSDTTHMSFMDAEGNAISTTQTINGWMGAAVVVPTTGILLNNEMDDFSALEGTMNMFGAVGGKPDAIAPQKTPLSSMSPTIVVHDGKPILALGAPGGTRIISCVAQTIMNVLEFHLSLYDAIATIRFHNQWLPDVLILEPPGPRPSVLARLKQMGYPIEMKPIGCTVQAVEREGNELHAVADPRDIGTSAAR